MILSEDEEYCICFDIISLVFMQQKFLTVNGKYYTLKIRIKELG